MSPSEKTGPGTPATPDSFHITSVLRPGTADTADSQAQNTFLNMEEESQDESLHDGLEPPSPGVEKSNLNESARPEIGNSLDELINRLLSLPLSKQEAKFVPAFLCLYQKFATPSQVLSAIIERFEQVERSSAAQLTKVGEQLRYLQVLALWTAEYPGDFATSAIRKEAVIFTTKLERSRIFAYAAKEINNHLEPLPTNEDHLWAQHDELIPQHNRSVATRSVDTSPSKKSSTDELAKLSSQSSLEDIDETSARHSGAPSNTSSRPKTGHTSNHSLAAQLNFREIEQQAIMLVPSPRNRLSKVHWHEFMEIPDEDFARELTRIDWVLYSSIRPRDFVGLVSGTSEQKRSTKIPGNVTRMINHFNHIAVFVSSMILLRDKPKHRAKALEKFMSIAWKVRQLNNYNTLGSIIAGINGSAIHRLALTRELVPQNVQKEFMRLTILMGTMRSHAAYRLAWENSFSERIPFLPLIRRDLAAAEDGNRTFVGPEGDKINWKKFEIMGEIIIGIQKSQDRPYPYLPADESIAKLVLETRICDEVMSLRWALEELADLFT